MHSKRSQEGYLLVDHRNSPGITEADLATVPLQRRHEFQTMRGLFESPTVTCCHCGSVVVINPQRIRARHYCAPCDHYVCDQYACITTCTPVRKAMDATIETAAQQLNLKET
jgi:hypothetical protein